MGATFRPDRSAIRPLMEDAMGRRRLAILALLVLVVSLPAPVAAQTKDDTLVYAIQSDMQNWDPPNSVLPEPSSPANQASITSRPPVSRPARAGPGLPPPCRNPATPPGR